MVVFLSVVFIWFLGNLLGTGDRTFIAFGQYFSLNWIQWTGSSLYPWAIWEKIVRENFGSVTSILQVFLSNPTVFLRHVLGKCSFSGKMAGTGFI